VGIIKFKALHALMLNLNIAVAFAERNLKNIASGG
jgi:hypothetical protein